MTTEQELMNKSEELCKLSGIKPRKYIKIFTNEAKAAKYGRKLMDKNKKAFDIDSLADRESSVFEIRWKEYPDLFLSSNNLKLYKLIIDCGINIFSFKSQLKNDNSIVCEFQDFILYDEKYNLIDDDFEVCMERSADTFENALISTLYYCLGGEITDDNMYNSWIPLSCCINYSAEINKVCDKFDKIKTLMQQTEWEY